MKSLYTFLLALGLILAEAPGVVQAQNQQLALKLPLYAAAADRDAHHEYTVRDAAATAADTDLTYYGYDVYARRESSRLGWIVRAGVSAPTREAKVGLKVIMQW